MSKLVQLVTLLLSVVGLLTNFTAAQLLNPIDPEASTEGVISMRLKLKQDALWDENATLEEVSEEERTEYINEALMEVSSKMKRKHKQKGMSDFKVLDQQGVLIYVLYPKLKSADPDQDAMTDAELKDLATKVLSTGVVNTINVMRGGEDVDIFSLEAAQEQATANFEKRRAESKTDEYDLRIQKERKKASEKEMKEIEAIYQKKMEDEEEHKNIKLQALEVMQDTYNDMNSKLERINQMIYDLQKQHDKNHEARVAYEKANGITDGEARLQAAVEEARSRYNLADGKLIKEDPPTNQTASEQPADGTIPEGSTAIEESTSETTTQADVKDSIVNEEL